MPTELEYMECVGLLVSDIIDLEDVPHEYRDYNLYLTWIKNGGKLSLVPDEFRTRELCAHCLENHDDIHHNLFYFPLQYQSEKTWEYALRLRTNNIVEYSLSFIPEYLLDYGFIIQIAFLMSIHYPEDTDCIGILENKLAPENRRIGFEYKDVVEFKDQFDIARKMIHEYGYEGAYYEYHDLYDDRID